MKRVTCQILIVFFSLMTAHRVFSQTAEDGEILRVQTNMVQFDLRVTDRKGKICGVNKEDIRIYADGEEQQLTYLTKEPIRHYNVLVDSSSSMYGKKFSRTVQGVKALINAGSHDQTFSIYTFADNLQFLGDYNSSNGELAGRTLEGVKADGNTALYDAAAQVLEKSKADTIQSALIIFTDGEDSASKTSGSQLQDQLGLKNNLTYLIVLNNQLLYRDEWTFPDDGSAKIAGERFQTIFQSILLLPTTLGELKSITASIPSEAVDIMRVAFSPTGKSDGSGAHSIRVVHSDGKMILFYRNTYRISDGGF